tara:strand:+ start:75 stop:710 length:636 start_codon:yes stop_codon:yes gene_type:complete
MDLTFEKVLVLSPHTDDGELGAGGLIARLVESGSQVKYLGFSACEESVPAGFPQDILRRECVDACAVLGIQSDMVQILDYRVRRFSEKRQEILDDMISIRNSFRPELVICPSLGDVHQDHGVIAQEAVRAFKQNCLLSYELPWNSFSFNNQLGVRLTEEQVEKKANAIGCYKSQGHRDYMQEDYIVAAAKTRGCQLGTSFSEMYEVIRWVL